MLLLDIVWFFIIAHVIMSWLINFQVLNLRQPIVAQIWDALNRILEPMYSRIRRVIPAMSGIDLAPLVALIGVYILRIILANNAGWFYSF
jgi:YggT family protein